jgi:DNA-binding PadR family transcriptional regulator
MPRCRIGTKMPLTAHQFVVAAALRGGPKVGPELRKDMESSGLLTSNEAFYQLVKRMELEGLLRSKRAKYANSPTTYFPTLKGTKECVETLDFYKSILSDSQGTSLV